ncbi:MAG: phosphate ABC transporter permease PstA [Thermodesulfobacteriota bacterium]
MSSDPQRARGKDINGDTSVQSQRALDIVRRGLGKRYRAERRFRMYGFAAVFTSLLFLVIVFVSIFSKGYTAFTQTYIQVQVYLDPTHIDRAAPSEGNYQGLIKESLLKAFPDADTRQLKRQLWALISPGAAYELRDLVVKRPELIGQTISLALPADDDVDMLMKGHTGRQGPEESRRLTDKQMAWIGQMEKDGRIRQQFNWAFFTNGDSREPELAGIRGALYGSFFTLLVTLLLSFPAGVAAAVYLEEFAPKNRFTDLIEVNINNLAAVPSIVFGLLGLAVYIGYFGLPRSTPIVGGLVMTLMTLPIIIIASRASLKSVPPSIREAALGVGASPVQTVLHHVLPLALPGILTGTIIGMARALGETAPLLMIGMVAFIVDVPHGFTDPATVLPVQIYLWSDSPERGFVEKTSAAIMVLLVFLIFMNSAAVWLRRRFERRW